MILDDWLAQRGQTSPDRIALTFGGLELTYAELEAAASSAARRLAAQGARRDADVVLSMPAGPDYVILLHALIKLGAIACPIDPRLPDAEREDRLDVLQPSLTLNSTEALSGTEADLPLLGEHDMDAVQCRVMTSGTTRTPHPVALTYGNHLWSAVGSAFNLGVDPHDRWLCCLPLFHVSGLSIVLRSVIYGTAIVIQDGFEVDAVAASLESEGVTVVSLVATMLDRLLEADAPLELPRAILVGGGPVPKASLEEAIGRGATVVQTYGLTEASSQVTTLSPGDARRKLGSAGRPLFTTHLRIVDGEILVQGPVVAPGRADEEDWLHTGDLGWIDDEGFLYVEGRVDDLIISGGENVVPDEIEEVLLRHPLVSDAAVVGRPDPDWQQAVTAVVVLDGGAEVSADELRSHCAELLAAYKVPKEIEFAAELPRTASGKLMRSALR
ncbi:MAG: o-succinylbenzoate---CoA ligase [Solirubrobacterales bacterium]|nr:o-succinylbenzoate---CoA ligase [Solirubrobacterales bacterium]MDX6662168.1 o-succinylbenzoate---CoA ligase [Solirubrobacterales bacterium]